MARIETPDLAHLLHSRGQRVTSQRVVILRELRRMGTHVPVEAVWRTVRAQLPTTALPTVYATLELLVELGLARRIETGGSALYDARIEPHQHAICRGCGLVLDVPGRLQADELLRAARTAGFDPESAELVISGLCQRCAAGAVTAPSRGRSSRPASAGRRAR
jgi:Fe2+ or Zn2+ uptake regulation protein